MSSNSTPGHAPVVAGPSNKTQGNALSNAPPLSDTIPFRNRRGNWKQFPQNRKGAANQNTFNTQGPRQDNHNGRIEAVGQQHQQQGEASGVNSGEKFNPPTGPSSMMASSQRGPKNWNNAKTSNPPKGPSPMPSAGPRHNNAFNGQHPGNTNQAIALPPRSRFTTQDVRLEPGYPHHGPDRSIIQAKGSTAIIGNASFDRQELQSRARDSEFGSAGLVVFQPKAGGSSVADTVLLQKLDLMISRIEVLEADRSFQAKVIRELEKANGMNIANIEALKRVNGMIIAKVEALEKVNGMNIAKVEALEGRIGALEQQTGSQENTKSTTQSWNHFADDNTAKNLASGRYEEFQKIPDRRERQNAFTPRQSGNFQKGSMANAASKPIDNTGKPMYRSAQGPLTKARAPAATGPAAPAASSRVVAAGSSSKNVSNQRSSIAPRPTGVGLVVELTPAVSDDPQVVDAGITEFITHTKAKSAGGLSSSKWAEGGAYREKAEKAETSETLTKPVLQASKDKGVDKVDEVPMKQLKQKGVDKVDEVPMKQLKQKGEEPEQLLVAKPEHGHPKHKVKELEGIMVLSQELPASEKVEPAAAKPEEHENIVAAAAKVELPTSEKVENVVAAAANVELPASEKAVSDGGKREEHDEVVVTKSGLAVPDKFNWADEVDDEEQEGEGTGAIDSDGIKIRGRGRTGFWA